MSDFLDPESIALLSEQASGSNLGADEPMPTMPQYQAPPTPRVNPTLLAISRGLMQMPAPTPNYRGRINPGAAFLHGLFTSAGTAIAAKQAEMLDPNAAARAEWQNKVNLDTYDKQYSGWETRQSARAAAMNPKAPADELSRAVALAPTLPNEQPFEKLLRVKKALGSIGAGSELDRAIATAPDVPGESSYQKLLRVKKDMAAAGREPKPGLTPDDYAYDVQKDMKGNAYLDLSKYTGKEGHAGALAAARKLGVNALNGPQASALNKLDDAQMNIPVILNALDGFAPKDWAGRPLQAAKVKLSQWSQSDPQAASYSALQLAAIQFITAVAGGQGSGLRINQAEIQRSINNDMPKVTDTIPVARNKLSNLSKLLDDLRNSIVVKDRSKLPGGVNAGVNVGRDANGKLVIQ